MKLRIKITAIFLLPLLTVLVSGCYNDRDTLVNGVANIFLSVRATTNINVDQTYWEDRVDEIRMIVFDASTGSTEFNQILYFPDGFNFASKAVQLKPGDYDFYFIANETVYSGNFTNALINISNRSEFSSNAAFRTLDYRPEFVPDGTTGRGRFLMSAIYEDITIVAGGTPANPLPLPLPTGKVELIRALAKVDVVFRKKVSGSSIPENHITSVQLTNVASNFSVPPEDEYYTGIRRSSDLASLTGLNYTNDSIGTVTFYIPEMLLPENASDYTELHINNEAFPIESDHDKVGLLDQRRDITGLSDNSVIRNYHYVINAYLNAEGGIQIEVHVTPWKKDTYIFIFQGDQQITIPPVEPTDSSIIITTECGKVEILSTNEFLSSGLQGAYNDAPDYANNVIIKGDPPYYCEQKYGPGWRLINSCELLSFLAAFDIAYNIWLSNTWLANSYPEAAPYYPLPFRQAAQLLLEKLTGVDLSNTVLQSVNNWQDVIPDNKLGIVDDYFTPGDIMLKAEDFPEGWPFEAQPQGADWYYNEVVIQVKPFWYGSDQYFSLENRENWDKVLYSQFVRYDYSSTVSRCVRLIE